MRAHITVLYGFTLCRVLSSCMCENTCDARGRPRWGRPREGNTRDRDSGSRSGRGILIPAMQFGSILTTCFRMKPASRLVELLRFSFPKPSGVISYEGEALRSGASGEWGACGARERAHQSLHHERYGVALLRVAHCGARLVQKVFGGASTASCIARRRRARIALGREVRNERISWQNYRKPHR